MNQQADVITEAIEAILNSKKYRGLSIPEETIEHLLQTELDKGIKLKVAIKTVRHKLHNIMASYLGDPDYEEAKFWLDEAFKNPDEDSEKQVCETLLTIHASTRERMPYLDEFYQSIFSVTGNPDSVLDLACAMHPFSFPWMRLSNSCEYYAYDIHQPRIDLINHYFQHRGLRPLAENRDILLHPPEIKADVAFLFKEAHRLEQRQQGCNLPLWETLQVNWLVVTLPAYSLNKKHNLRKKHRMLITSILQERDWLMNEQEIGGELIFFIKPKSI